MDNPDKTTPSGTPKKPSLWKTKRKEILLGSAIAMAVISAQYPFVQPWLTAKFFGLLAYIVFGMMALKRGRTKGQRAAWLLAALLAFAYIVSVALARDPLGFLA